MKTLLLMPHILAPYADRIEPDGSCWIWKGSTQHAGYPEVNVKVAGKWRTKRLTRMVCEDRHGPLGSLEARHTCNVRSCVNPDHLVPGTHQQNIDDKQIHGTHNKGVRNPMSKLTPEDVAAIRAMKGVRTQAQIAAEYGVSQSAVSRVMTGCRW